MLMINSSIKKLALVLILLASTVYFLNTSPDDATISSEPIVSNNKIITEKAPASLQEKIREAYSKYSGVVKNIRSGGGYVFLEVMLPSGKSQNLASASLPYKIDLGDQVYWNNSKIARNYQSHSLNVKFDVLHMVTLEPKLPTSGIVRDIKNNKDFKEISLTNNTEQFVVILKPMTEYGHFKVGDQLGWGYSDIESVEPARNKGQQRIHIKILSVNKHSQNKGL